MSTHDSFLAAVRESPDDEAGRLVFADWLEDNGQPARAELIRTQVAEQRLPSAERPPLTRRANELVRAHWNEWVEPVRQLLAISSEDSWMHRRPAHRDASGFTGGFICSLTLPARRFVECAEGLFRLVPLSHLRLRGAGAVAAELADCPQLGWVRSVDFVDYYSDPVDAAAMFRLASSPWLSGWRSLGLFANNLGDSGAEALASAEWLTGLQTLDLTDNGLSARGVGSLARAGGRFRPRQLNLQRNPIGDAGARAVATSPVASGLEALSLGACEVGDAGADALAGSPLLRQLVVLDLSDNPNISESAWVRLRRAAWWPGLRHVMW